MAENARIKGVALLLKIGTPPVDYFADVTSCTIENEETDNDVITFSDAQKGETRDYVLKIGAIQSTATASLWRHIWENSGNTVEFTYAPHGNAAPSADEPHFVGSVIIGPPPALGGEAGKKTTYVFETEWEIVGKPVLTPVA